jgi:predicted peroxiredoxin
LAKLLIITTAGSGDPTRASLPFHIAVNGAAAGGVESDIALAGDATELVKTEVAARVKGVGVPPLADLIAACRLKGVRFYVSKECADARGVAPSHLDSLAARYVSPPELVRLSIAADRVLAF